MPDSVSRDNRGFTLVELIVAIVILAIVFVPLLHTFVTGAQTEAKSRRYQSATAAAQNIIESVQATNIDTLLTDARVWSSSNSGTFLDNEGNTVPSAVLPTGSVKLSGGDFDSIVSYTAKSNSQTGNFVSGASLDALFDMTNADTNANTDFLTEAARHGSDGTANITSRTISISAAHDTTTGFEGYYKVTVTFNYKGNYTYTPVVAQGEDPQPAQSVDYSSTITTDERVLMRTVNANDPAFSVYLFFKAGSIDHDGSLYKDSISIGNNINQSTDAVKRDFNVFLVDATKSSEKPASYRPTISYKTQYIDGSRVFSNFTNCGDSLPYRSYRKGSWYYSRIVSKELVISESKPREIDFSVAVYPKNDPTNAVCTISASKIG